MDRGEVMGNCGVNTSAIQATFPEQYKSGKVRVLLQAAMKSDARFADVPNIIDEAKKPEDRQALEYMFSTLELGRPFAVPPQTPPDRIALLRNAFDRAISDPDLRSEASRLQLDLDVMDHSQTEASVRRLYATPHQVVERVQSILNSTGR
jgi:tripartite-type tricarboxylate transporter receptor subunit TctC